MARGLTGMHIIIKLHRNTSGLYPCLPNMIADEVHDCLIIIHHRCLSTKLVPRSPDVLGRIAFTKDGVFLARRVAVMEITAFGMSGFDRAVRLRATFQ